MISIETAQPRLHQTSLCSEGIGREKPNLVMAGKGSEPAPLGW
jgi:hypothetical protein